MLKLDISKAQFHLKWSPIYNIDETTSIVISNVKFGFVDFLASFSYVFVFYIILYTIMIFFIFFPENIKGFNYDFKNKIKFSMIGVLLLSLIIVGTGTIKYSINQFEKNLYGSIGEKIQSSISCYWVVFVDVYKKKIRLAGEVNETDITNIIPAGIARLRTQTHP